MNKTENKTENKTAYMNMLRQELEGLPADVIEDCMWSYEGKFIDGMAAGYSEAQISASLPKPSLVAAQKRAGIRYQSLRTGGTVSKVLSLLIAALGVLVFNFFMLIPAIVYSAMLFAAYLSSLALYLAGILITAASLSGVAQIELDFPLSYTAASSQALAANGDNTISQKPGVKLEISSAGIVLEEDSSVTGTELEAADIGSSGLHVEVENKLQIEHAVQGFGMLLGAIALFMLSLFMTRYSFLGLKNYLHWNLSLLRAPVTASVAASVAVAA